MQNGSQIARSISLAFSSVETRRLLNLCGRRIAGAFIIDPADLQIVALFATLEAELDVGVLGNGRSPVRDEYVLAVVFESQLLDEMRRARLPPCILYTPRTPW